MQLGYIGLGKMGKNMAMRLVEKGHDLVVWNRSLGPVQELLHVGAKSAATIEELIQKLAAPRTLWVMLPAGDATETMLDTLADHLESGDTIINGANEYYLESKRHALDWHAKGVHFLDAGVSGGPAGAKNGACVMVGGEQHAFDRLEQLFADIAAPGAYQFFPGAGAGHFVKMVHNGIEYGMMQAIAEGFDILKRADYNLDLEAVARIYNHRSVIESRLVGWMLSGFQDFGQNLTNISGSAGSGGAAGMTQSEAKWTLDVATEQATPTPVIQASVDARLQSQKEPNFQGKVINALRHQFGGHEVKKNP